MTVIRFTADGVYEALCGGVDSDAPKYRYWVPATDDNGEFWVVDCWPTDAEGEVHPGYGCSPVPVLAQCIGGMVKHLACVS